MELDEQVPIDLIVFKFNPRVSMGAISELAQMIEASGWINPICLAEEGDGYRLIYGERRLRAAKLLKLETIPAIIYPEGETVDEETIKLQENLGRKDLYWFEIARTLTVYSVEYGIAISQCGKLFNRSAKYAQNLKRAYLAVDPELHERIYKERNIELQAALACEFKTIDEQKEILWPKTKQQRKDKKTITKQKVQRILAQMETIEGNHRPTKREKQLMRHLLGLSRNPFDSLTMRKG